MAGNLLNLLGKVFLGRGIDKKFPFLISLFQKIYLAFQKDELRKVTIPLDLKLWVSAKDAGVGLYLLSQGKFEETQTKLFIKNLKPSDVVFDIGANIGYYTVLASQKVREKGKVYAFEPDKRNLRLLKKNLALNHCQNVEIISKALSERGGPMNFEFHQANPGESRLSPANRQGQTVLTTTIDSFTKKRKIKKINLIKIDIEGAEVMALNGGEEFLSSLPHSKLFIECNPKALKEFGTNKETLLETIIKLGFKVEKTICESEKDAFDFNRKKLKNILRKRGYVNLFCEK